MDHTRPACARHLVAYASGLSRIPDFRTAAWAGHGIGVVAGELSRAALPILAQAVVDYRAPLFVDSGAYGAFREGRASLVDHGAVMDRYDAIIDAIGDANEAEERLPPPLFVMPDTPGDQKATLRLVHSYRHRIENLLAFACGRPIIVLHTGPRRLSSVYRDLAESFGRDDFIVGVPSAAAALSDAAAEDLFAAGRPKHVHILGALSDRRLGPRLAQLDRARIAPQSVSADANLLRSRVNKAGQGVDARLAATAAELGQQARLDELEAVVERLGGDVGLRSAFAAGDADRRRRLVGLVRDLGGQSEAAAMERLAGQAGPRLAA